MCWLSVDWVTMLQKRRGHILKPSQSCCVYCTHRSNVQGLCSHCSAQQGGDCSWAHRLSQGSVCYIGMREAQKWQQTASAHPKPWEEWMSSGADGTVGTAPWEFRLRGKKSSPCPVFSGRFWTLLSVPQNGTGIFYLLFHLYSKGEFSLIFQSTIICIFALGCHWTVPETCTSTELLPDDGFMSSSKHPITNPISCTCIFSPYFVLLRTALPSYVTYTACRYQCNSLGSAASRQFP